jgi:chemotaxis protein methyltransferase CheR
LRDPYPGPMDLIICRNVVIYFTEEVKREMYQKIYAALKPGGFLFIGSTEQILNARNIGFESSALFFYRKPI